VGGRVRNESQVLQVQLCTAALLHSAARRYSTVQNNAIQCTAIHCDAVRCNTMRRGAVIAMLQGDRIGNRRDGGQEGEEEMGSEER
jgi:hypothetical protein